MPIMPLPQFEADLKEYEDQLAAEAAALKAPKSMVVRFGVMRLIGEYPYDGSIKPGCGSKVVARTHRGTELAEVLTVTCQNSGCGKSVTRKEMLGYIEASGGRDYPFFSQGQVLRIATVGDMEAQAALEQAKHEQVRRARDVAQAVRSPVKMVDAEALLGGERIIYYYLSEERVDLRELHHELDRLHDTRVELRQVGARDEARLIADYERCGQHCCCKNFLKVLKPISMRSAKTQKATLEPLKISGRCGRLMCCLRYEDETYEDLRKKLPNRKKRVGTPHGDGIVIQGQILTQLVLVRLDAGTDVAVPVEELTEPGSATAPPPREPRPERGRRERRPREGQETRERREPAPTPQAAAPAPAAAEGEPKKKKKRRRKKRKPLGEAGALPGADSSPDTGPDTDDESGGTDADDTPQDEHDPHGTEGAPPPGADAEGPRKKKRKRRKRKHRPDGAPGTDTGAGPPDQP
ncbi:MAG: hypothetical protein IT431_04715 [Phycisphaerales bacterium]|nr:hypothetical protein [Phycisphaerales bacterium]